MAVNVDWDVVENVEDLDKIFKKAISRAEETEEPEIRQQWSESKAEFWQRRASAEELRGAKRDALEKYPLAKEFADDIHGGSAADIEAQAKRFHERMEKVTKDAEEAKAAATKATEDAQALARTQYGNPAAAGGGTPARAATEGFDSLEKEVHDRLKRGDGLGDARGKLVQRQWQDQRIAMGIEAAIKSPSYRSFSRSSSDDRKVQDDRTRRKGG